MKKLMTGLLSSAALILSTILSTTAQAKMVTIEDISAAQMKTEIIQTLARDEIKSKLQQLGVQPEELNSRIDNLDQAELQQLHHHMEDLPAGGDGLGLIVFIFIVFVITDAIGATDVFPFVNKVE